YVKELVFDFGGYEEQAACRNFGVIAGSAEAGASAKHMVKLVLMMGDLRVDGTGGQDVEAGAHGRNAKELAVELAGAGSIAIDVCDCGEQRLHARIPPRTSSVNCGTRLGACKFASGLYH